MSPRIKVITDCYGGGDCDDVIAVYIDDREVAAYCIVEDAEAERAAFEAMVRAVEQVGREAASRAGGER